jgi:hypothetical protein
MSRNIHPLVSLSVIVLLSLFIASVLFGILSSTGIIKSRHAEFGGAAAGFFAALYLLQRWYLRMEGAHNEIKELRESLRKMRIPDFELPPDFTPYIDQEHSMLLAYPVKWKRHPVKLSMQSVFSEDPLALRPGDEYPGKFNFVVSSPGQEAYSLKELAMMARSYNISDDTLEKELGVELSERTESLQVPLERVLNLFGAEGHTRREAIYSITYQFFEMIANKIVRKDIEFVDRIESLLVEWLREQEVGEPLVFFSVITYAEETDLIFTFQFVDNISDRSKIERVRKQVLSTVKFWGPTG